MVSTELSKYTVPDDVENSNYVNIGFLHTVSLCELLTLNIKNKH